MPRLLTMTNAPLPGNLLLIGGSSFPFKVSGLGPDKKHVIIKCDSSAVSVTVLRANPNNIEQTLRLDVDSNVAVASKAKLTAYLGSDAAKLESSTAAVSVSIEPRLELPQPGTEEGIVTRMLLVENITPEQAGFSMQQVRTAMQNMLWVLRNRIAAGSHHFGTKGDVTSLTENIKAPGQVEGFQNYPSIAAKQNSTLNDILKFSNDSSYGKAAVFREFVRAAIETAKGNNGSPDPCPTKLYGWKTKGSDSPGSNFVKFVSMGGQDFYTLTDDFLKSIAK